MKAKIKHEYIIRNVIIKLNIVNIYIYIYIYREREREREREQYMKRDQTLTDPSSEPEISSESSSENTKQVTAL